jgi:methylmalonyl-CoA/ethylmalonyl-CoA epimerase
MLPYFTFHHIGIATRDISKTAKYYIEAGFYMSEIIIDPIQKVKISFLTKEQMPRIELLEPAADDSPVSQILEKSGTGPYHICYEVNNIEETIKDLKKNRFLPLFKPVRAVALDNRLICFLYNTEVGLIEILEK